MSRKIFFSLALVGLFLVAGSALRAEEVPVEELSFVAGDEGSFSKTEDGYQRTLYPNHSHNTSVSLCAGKSATETRVSVVRFPDIIGNSPGQIPHDAVITEAKLTLTSCAALQMNVEAYLVTESWSYVEGRAGTGCPTWNSRLNGGSSWSVAGCGYLDADTKSRAANPLDTVLINQNYQPFQWDITSAVQLWANDADLNMGVVLENRLATAIQSFYSSENVTYPARRPVLTVKFQRIDTQAPNVAITSSLSSNTKKIFIEGTKDVEVEGITLTAGGQNVDVTVISPTRWYAQVERTAGATSLALVASAVDAASNQGQATATLNFTAVDAASPTNILMLAGNSALITVTGTGAIVEVNPGNGAAVLTGVPSDVFEVAYPVAGNYSATVKIDGVEVGVVPVTAVDIDFDGKVMCEVGFRREKAVAVAPLTARDEITFSGDADGSGHLDLLDACKKEDTTTGVTLFIEPLQRGTPRVFVRSSCGKLLVVHEVDEFELSTTCEKYIGLVEEFPDGSLLVEAELVLKPELPGLDIDLHAFAAGVTFEDSTLDMSVVSDDFTGTPEEVRLPYRMIMSQGIVTGPCHTILAYQDGVRVGGQ
jgi:hypothetical protein